MKRHRSDTYVSKLGSHQKRLYDPKRLEDLVINRNRIKDVGDWMDLAVLSPRAIMLLVYGPPGCGKTTTVRVLAAEKGIEMIEWTTPVDSYEYCDDSEYLKPVSVACKFKNFLLGIGRYSSVVRDRNMTDTCSRLIVVKDFPTCFLSSPDQFTNIIDFYVVHGRISIIFICAESTTKKYVDIAYELFREEFKLKHSISQIHFIPVPIRSIVNALKRVEQISHIQISEDLLRDIAIESRGDLQKAINELYMLSVNGSMAKKYIPSVKKRQLKKGDTVKSNSKKLIVKETTGLFHSVGRVLYAKRSNCHEDHNEVKSDEDHNGDLVHSPLDIAKEFSHYSNQFVSIAHSNYLDIFSSIECIAKAAEYLSDSDVIMSEWREKELLSDVGFSVAVCGLMESNINPVRRWKPLKGSQWNEDLKMAITNRVCIENLLSDSNVSKCNIILDAVPYMTKMWRFKNDESQCTKWCAYGFLPHRTEDLLSVIRKMKTDVLICSSLLPCRSKSESDESIHISEDSD